MRRWWGDRKDLIVGGLRVIIGLAGVLIGVFAAIFVAIPVLDIGATSVNVVSADTEYSTGKVTSATCTGRTAAGRSVTVMSRHCVPGTYRAVDSADSTVWNSDPGLGAIGRQLAIPAVFLLFGLGLTVGGIRNVRQG